LVAAIKINAILHGVYTLIEEDASLNTALFLILQYVAPLIIRRFFHYAFDAGSVAISRAQYLSKAARAVQHLF
jgi:hypothetical protein